MSYTTFDLETTVKAAGKRKASPFHPDNKIVAIGWKRQNCPVNGSYSKTGEHHPNWFEGLLAGTKLLVGQNIKFDILYAITRSDSAYQAWMEWVEAGGNVWDCQLAEYLLRGQEQSAHMLSMDEMVEEYGGNTKVDEVKAMWNAGYDTTEIPEDLLMRYLLGEDTPDGRVFGDIENTEAIFKGQLEKARKRGHMKSIMLNMGSLLATIEMEKNGMAVDRELGYAQAEKLKVACKELRERMQQYLPNDLPFQFNWGSGHHLSALIFGGRIKYSARDYVLDDDGNVQYAKGKGLAYELLNGEFVVPKDDIHLKQLEENLARYKAGKKKGQPRTKIVDVDDLTKPKMKNMDFFYEFDGFTDPETKWETKHEGVYATNADVIEELSTRDIPFLKDLTKLNKMDKDLTTYYMVEDEKKPGMYKGMLTLVGPDSIIHGSINHTSTVTGRFSASNPNLQNLPRADTSEVKKLFISRFGAEGSMVQSDFSSLEIYIQALLTGDRQLLADLKAGLDMHCVRVAKKFHIEYEEAVRRCKKDKSAPDFKLWKSRRTGCKEFSFQRAYGAGAKAVAASTGMDLADVEELIRLEDERYPQIEPFYVRVTEAINASRVPTSLWVHHPEIRGLSVCIGKGFYRTPDGKKYTYREYPAPAGFIKRGGANASFSPPEIKNYIVQGTGGEWAKAAMWLAVRYFYRHKNWNGLALLVNMVHDAQYVDAHNSVRVEACVALHAAMEAASEFMEQRFEWTVEAPVPSETTFGPSMYVEYAIDEDTVNDDTGEIIQPAICPDFAARVRATRLELRKLYMNDYQPSFEEAA